MSLILVYQVYPEWAMTFFANFTTTLPLFCELRNEREVEKQLAVPLENIRPTSALINYAVT